MPGKVTKEVTREREKRAWELRQAGWTQERIASELGVDDATVSKMLGRIDQRVLKQLESAVSAMKVAEDSRLSFIIDESLRAWERSKSPAIAKRVTKSKSGEKDAGDAVGDAKQDSRSQETISQEAQCGDARYLVEARAAMADRRKLWGLDAPLKVANTNAKGEDLRLDDIGGLLKKMKNWTPDADSKEGVAAAGQGEPPASITQPAAPSEPTE